MEENVRSAQSIQVKVNALQSTKVIKLDGGRKLINEAIKLFGWTSHTRFAWQLDQTSISLLTQEGGKSGAWCDNSNFDSYILRCRLNIKFDEHELILERQLLRKKIHLNKLQLANNEFFIH